LAKSSNNSRKGAKAQRRNEKKAAEKRRSPKEGSPQAVGVSMWSAALFRRFGFS
jgi:hypothetical protein